MPEPGNTSIYQNPVSSPNNPGSNRFENLEGAPPEFVNDMPGFAVQAYWQALAADERQYGVSAEYVKQFYEFVKELYDEAIAAIESGQTTIERGDRFQAYSDDDQLGSQTNAFFDILFGESGSISVSDLINNEAFRRALGNYGDLGNFYDFAAGYRDLDLDPFDAYSAEPTQESVIDQITDAFEQGTDALGNLLSGLIPEDMTIEGFLDWIKENVPENTPTDIFEQVLGQGVGIIFDGSGVTFDPTQGRIFVPGLPGVPLPPSSTILGTLEDLIEDPIGTVGTWGEDVWSQVLEGVQDPGAVIEGIFGEQEVPQSVISVILGSETLQDILGDWINTVVEVVDPNESTVDGDTTIGGGVTDDDDDGDSVTNEEDTFEGDLPGVEEDEEDDLSSETDPPEPPSGTTESGGRKSLFDDSAFKPFDYSIAYQLPQLQQQIRPQQKDYNQQLEGLIGRSLFGKMIG